jgi:hypothetical protein
MENMKEGQQASIFCSHSFFVLLNHKYCLFLNFSKTLTLIFFYSMPSFDYEGTIFSLHLFNINDILLEKKVHSGQINGIEERKTKEKLN